MFTLHALSISAFTIAAQDIEDGGRQNVLSYPSIDVSVLDVVL